MLYKITVGADATVRPSSKAGQNNGITLIALVITIIVMLILVAVTISMAINGGIFDYAGKAVGETQNAIDLEQQLANGRIKIGETWYDSIDDYINNIPSANQGDNFNGSTNYKMGDTYEQGDYIYTYYGLLNYKEAQEFFKNMVEQDSGMTWEEFLIAEGLSEEEAFALMGLTEDSFEAIGWNVSVIDNTKSSYVA